jgi:hypothetical protein
MTQNDKAVLNQISAKVSQRMTERAQQSSQPLDFNPVQPIVNQDDEDWSDYANGVAIRTNEELTSYEVGYDEGYGAGCKEGQYTGMREGYNLCLRDVSRGLNITVEQVRQLIVDGTPYRVLGDWTPQGNLLQPNKSQRRWRKWVMVALVVGLAIAAGAALAAVRAGF